MTILKEFSYRPPDKNMKYLTKFQIVEDIWKEVKSIVIYCNTCDNIVQHLSIPNEI